MVRRVAAAFVLFALLLAARAQTAAGAIPKLVVVISIDQFAGRYIQTFQPYFGDGGFNRFIRSGAVYQNSYFPYANTFTCPGHAAIGTGRLPVENGIVSNNWIERSSGKSVYCVEDERALVTAGKSGGMSPIHLTSDSFGDRLQERYPGAKVIGIAIKDRAAILMAGRKATAAYWLDKDLPGFISSTYYEGRRDVAPFNDTIPGFVARHAAWVQSDFIPTPALARVTFDPPELRKFKSEGSGMGTSFPHPIRNLDALVSTPYGNDLLLDFARWLIDREALGSLDGAPDLLFIGLSSQDYLGHRFGPDSLEVADAIVRTDRSLAAFLDMLERRFGDRVTVALTADHGVQSIPEVATARGEKGGRLLFREPRKEDTTLKDLAPDRLKVEKAIAARLKIPFEESAPVSMRFLAKVMEPSVYINWERARSLHIEPERLKTVVRDAMRTLPAVSAAFTDSELLVPNDRPDPIEISVRNSFLASRSGDVIVELKPGYIWGYSATGTTHGEPVEADQHVPLMFWGDGIMPGVHDDRVSPLDLATTLGAVVGLKAGSDEARALSCVRAADEK